MVVQSTNLEQVYRIGCADSVCKPPQAAVVKSYGAERSGKKMLYKQHQVSVKKLNIIESLMKCRNDYPLINLKNPPVLNPSPRTFLCKVYKPIL